MADLRTGYKVLTHDGRPPVQGGEPIYRGESLPFPLPPVTLNTSGDDCAAGWNYCGDLETALRISHFWPDGRPSVAFRVAAGPDAIQRKMKRRASELTLVERVSEAEIQEAIRQFSVVFAPHQEEMAQEQCLWRTALARPGRDQTGIEAGLRKALEVRGLDWQLREFLAPKAAWNARAARAAWAVSNAWAAWEVREAWTARAAGVAWAARDAWDIRARYTWPWASWDARAAWEALTVYFVARQGWIKDPPELLTAGLRDAYAAGLEVVLPTNSDELGWVMAERSGA